MQKNSKIGPFRIVTQVQQYPESSHFLVTLVLHFECVFREVQHIFVLSLTFLSKVRLIKNTYYCILIHSIAYCAFFAFPVHKKRHRALHFCKARCLRFDRFPVSSSLPEPSSGSVRSGPGSWCCGTRTAYRPDVQCVLGLHAGDQLANAFQVAVAAADDSMDAMVWSSFRTKLVCLEQVPLFAKLNSLLMVSNFLSLSYKGKAFSGFIVCHCRRPVCGRSPAGG